MRKWTLVTATAFAAALAVTAPGTTAHATANGRLVRAGTQSSGTLVSLNWSGYVAQAGGYTSITGFFTVPTVKPQTGTRYSSMWLGIGGAHDQSLIQAGIEADWINGAPHYNAWTEVLPAPENPLSLAIRAGDRMQVTVKQTTTGNWTMIVKDVTTGKQGSRSQAFASTESSAEAILERPQVNGTLANLAQTSNGVFDLVMVNGKVLGGAGQVALIKMSNGSKIIASPSALDSDKDGFAVADGATAPPAPGS